MEDAGVKGSVKWRLDLSREEEEEGAEQVKKEEEGCRRRQV